MTDRLIVISEKDMHDLVLTWVNEALAGKGNMRRTRRWITPDLLVEVARVYLEAPAQAPTKAVREHFNVSQAQASRYVAEARAAGVL